MVAKINFLEQIKQLAKQSPSNILLPESHLDDTTLEAGIFCAQQKLAFITLLSKPNQSKDLFQKIKQTFNKIPSNIQIIDPITYTKSLDFFAEQYYQIRKHKGINLQEATETIQSIYYYSPLLLHNQIVDGIVTGYLCSTKHSITPAIQILKPNNQPNYVSSYSLMLNHENTLFFADCAINIDPSAEELSHIALDTAQSALKFNIQPKIAFLSFSTNQSSNHHSNQKVVQATQITKKIVQEQNLPYQVEGDIQVDAALIPEICQKKFPNSTLKEPANILIFPNLFASNISYKLLERLGHIQTLGPIIQGLSAPFNDLSRGANLNDIINIIALSSVQASKQKSL